MVQLYADEDFPLLVVEELRTLGQSCQRMNGPTRAPNRRTRVPLLDHFHPPLSLERRWESFHAAWSGSLADALNQMLPAGYFAEEQTHAGAGVEIDVATLEGVATAPASRPNGPATATLPARAWSPPAP